MTFATTGKLLRGSLVCYSYALCSGETAPSPSVLNTAIALELSHTSLLIHDDVIDQDELRRGRPSMHYQYSQLFDRRSVTSTHLGDSLAICAGDMALLMAFELLGNVSIEQTADTSLSALLARELTTVCAGQMQDVYLAGSAKRPTKREIYTLMQTKSAGYSVAFPLMAGAILAGESAAVRRQLYDLGIAVGTMFQIRDDELGVLGNAGKLGKPVGADIREGKKTLLYHYLRQAASAKERQQLDAIFGNPKASQADIATVQEALLRYDIPSRLQTDLDQLKRIAVQCMNRLKLAPARKEELRQLVEFCANREV
jgi:geranylgeranyl diphosphate synthase type I